MMPYIILESDTIHGVAYTPRKINEETMEIPYWGKANANGYWADTSKKSGKRNQFKQDGPIVYGSHIARGIVFHAKQKARLQGKTILPVNF